MLLKLEIIVLLFPRSSRFPKRAEPAPSGVTSIIFCIQKDHQFREMRNEAADDAILSARSLVSRCVDLVVATSVRWEVSGGCLDGEAIA